MADDDPFVDIAQKDANTQSRTGPLQRQKPTDDDPFAAIAAKDRSASASAPWTPRPSIGHELAVQPVEGLYETAENIYNLPNYAVNWAARHLGYEEPIKPFKPLTTHFSTGEQPTTEAGRYARAIGQQVGAAAIPYAGMVARGMAPTTTALGRAVSLPATGEVAAQNLASAAGAGVAGQTVEENKQALGQYAPYAKAAAEVAGGFAGPTVYNAGAKATAVPANFVRYGSRLANEAAHPQMAADRDVIDVMKRSGTNPEEMRNDLMASFAGRSPLPSRNWAPEDLMDVIKRRVSGEKASAISTDYTRMGLPITPKTIDAYVTRYQQDNLTPMTPMALAEQIGERKGVAGASIPMVRDARAAATISKEVGPAQDILNVQRDQPVRMTKMVNRAFPNVATAADIRNLERSVQQQGVDVINAEYPAQNYEAGIKALRQQAKARQDADYTTLHSQPPVVVDDELASILANPEGAQAYKLAMGIARSEKQPIPTREELLKSFGLRDKEGFGLNEEGTTGPGLTAEARHNLQQMALDKKIAKLEKATGEDADPELLQELKNLREGLDLKWQTKSTGQYPSRSDAEPGALFTPKTLDYFQRALRKASKNLGDPNSEAFYNLRGRLIEHLDPETPTPDRPTLVQGLRSTMQRYRTDMGAEEAVELASKLKPKLDENAYDTLAQFEQMTHPQQELFRLRYARNMQDAIKNQAYGKDTLAQFDSPAHHEMIRRIYPMDVADRMINGLQSTRLTGKAYEMGQKLATRAHSEQVSDSEELRSFRDDMNPTQQALFRAGFGQELRNMINKKRIDANAESQFHTPNTQAVVREVLPPKDADPLLRGFKQEHIASNIKQGMYGQSTTAQQGLDVGDMRAAARATAHAGMGLWRRLLQDFYEEAAKQVGQRRAGLFLRQVGEINPFTNIENFDRQIAQIAADKNKNVDRGLLNIFRQKARDYLPGKAWVLGEALKLTAQGLKGPDHAQRLQDIETGPHSPEEKRDMRRKVIQDALLNP